MPCGCAEPCEPQPYRCSCERDCWVGDPALYASCMADCEEQGCEHPEYPGLPSRGYRCDTPPDTDYSDCQTGCAESDAGAQANCTEARNECEEGPNPELCASAYCSCLNQAAQNYQVCILDCDRDHAYPDAFSCAQTHVDDSESCCNVTLGNCYAPCEDAFLSAAAPIEQAYLACIRSANAIYPGFWYDDEGQCVSGGDPSLLQCERVRVMAMAPLFRDRANCRAACENAEIRRETPADRKYRECGGGYHECGISCDAQFNYDMAVAAYNAYPCIESCTQSSPDDDSYRACVEPCYATYRNAYVTATTTQGQCRIDCCKEENDHARHGHARAQCQFDCFASRLSDQVACYHAYTTCYNDAIADGVGGEIQCMEDWCSCFRVVRSGFDACRSQCAQKGDCPDCFKDAVNVIGQVGGEGYGVGAVGMPPVGIGPEFEPQGCPEEEEEE